MEEENKSNIIELTDEDVKEFERSLEELKSLMEETFSNVPINNDPYVTQLYADCCKVINLYEQAIKSKKWDESNNEFVTETVERLKELNASSFFFY